MKVAIWVISGTIAGILLAWAILGAVSRLHFHRSVLSTLGECLIRSSKTKKKIVTSEQAAAYVEKTGRENLSPYQIPKSVKFSVPLCERQEHGMQVFHLNGESASDTLVFYLHGGAYLNNPLSFHFKLCNQIAHEAGAHVIVPLYPKLPAHTYRDAYDAVTALYESYAKAGKRVILMGDSSGGGLALGLAQQLRDQGGLQPERLILICPWLDVALENPKLKDYEKVDPMHSIFFPKELGKLWAGEQSVCDSLISPMYGDMHGLGRISLFTGTREILCADILRMDALLKGQGIEHDLIIGQGLNHVYPVYPTPEGKKARKKIVELVQNKA